MRRTGSAAAALFLLTAFLFAGKTPSVAQATDTLPLILGEDGNPVPGSIVSLQKVNLGGVGQWILIRGRDRTKPVLLVLHGGPGYSMMPWVDMFQPDELEEHFVVVHWDQRGAGKSFSSALTAEDFAIDVFVDDTLELAGLLTRRFSQEKIFLTGVSWGSALGFLTLKRDSSPFRAFIAVSERVDWNRSQMMGFEWVRAEAAARNNAEAMQAIAEIEPFDPAQAADVGLKNRLVEVFGGGEFHTEGRWQGYLDYALEGRSPYYREAEIRNYMRGIVTSQGFVLPQSLDYNLLEDFPEADIPVHFISGAEDWQTPVALVEEYVEALKAPDKSLTIIQDTGHNVPLDAPRAWARTLIRIADEVAVR
ncbi:alpha/beta fold hydrolase [Oricola sp.]|uniref:alpha/beta fold hydrolase n=1 Tax=Oricola sp. TaxID=1979950 RepID=UPI003BAC2521